VIQPIQQVGKLNHPIQHLNQQNLPRLRQLAEQIKFN
jgi:hypothetical protein